MRKLLFQPEARVDLLEIWRHIANDNIAVANRVGDELDAAIRRLFRKKP
jgi:plasmid stabilization system protein ParE